MSQFRWAALIGICILHVIMQDPVYYLVAKIDIIGGSTGYHRAALIGAAINHLDEWWLIGTDRTRHWMPSGIYANEDHTDITNHYIAMGVMGGLPLMMLFILSIIYSLKAVSGLLWRKRDASWDDRFLAWSLGSVLFANFITFLTVSYFAEMLILYYFQLSLIAFLAADVQRGAARDRVQDSKLKLNKQSLSAITTFRLMPFAY